MGFRRQNLRKFIHLFKKWHCNKFGTSLPPPRLQNVSFWQTLTPPLMLTSFMNANYRNLYTMSIEILMYLVQNSNARGNRIYNGEAFIKYCYVGHLTSIIAKWNEGEVFRILFFDSTVWPYFWSQSPIRLLLIGDWIWCLLAQIA